MSWSVFLGVLLGIVTNELYDLSGWVARPAVRLAALLWTRDPERRSMYAEAWLADLNDCPSNLWRLGIALRFVTAGLGIRAKTFVRVAGSVSLRTLRPDGIDGNSTKLGLAVGIVAAISLVFVGWSVAEAVHGFSRSPWLRIAAVAVMLALASRSVLRIRIRSMRQAMTFFDAVILFGLMLVPGTWLILITALVTSTVCLLRRLPLIKMLFNAAKDTAVAGLTVLVAWSLGLVGPFTPTSHALPAIVAAALTVAVADEAFAIPIIALATYTPVIRFFFSGLGVRLGCTVLRLALAIMALFALAELPELVVVVPVAIFCLQIVSASQARGRAERAAWQLLARTTNELNEIRLDAVLTSAVNRASSLFSADEVEVLVTVAPVDDRLVRGNATAIDYDGPQAVAPVRSGQLVDVPLDGFGGGPAVGALRLRFSGKVVLTEREHYALRTFAAALSIAIRNAVAFAETERISAQHEHAATHDPLTGLANGRRFFQVGAEAVSGRAVDGHVGLLLVDLDHFKDVNKTLGRVAGDKVLAEVGRRLASAIRPGELVARLGGDEFAVLLVGIPTLAAALSRSRVVMAALHGPMEISGVRLLVEASAAIALTPARGGIQELMRRADHAMCAAKDNGGGIAAYASSDDRFEDPGPPVTGVAIA